jgi:hypothetical protein
MRSRLKRRLRRGALERFILLGGYAEKAPADLTSEARGFMEGLAAAFSENESFLPYCAGYLVLALMRGVLGIESSGEDARRLVDHWCLDRKLREAYRDSGRDAEEAYRIVTLLKLILSRTAEKSEASAAAPTRPAAHSIVKSAFAADDARAFFGVNVFEGVVWYNKERFEEALRYAGAVAAVESDEALFPVGARAKKHAGKAPDTAAWHKRLNAVAAAVAAVEKSHAAAGYQAETLIEGLEEKPSSGREDAGSIS